MFRLGCRNLGFGRTRRVTSGDPTSGALTIRVAPSRVLWMDRGGVRVSDWSAVGGEHLPRDSETSWDRPRIVRPVPTYLRDRYAGVSTFYGTAARNGSRRAEVKPIGQTLIIRAARTYVRMRARRNAPVNGIDISRPGRSLVPVASTERQTADAGSFGADASRGPRRRPVARPHVWVPAAGRGGASPGPRGQTRARRARLRRTPARCSPDAPSDTNRHRRRGGRVAWLGPSAP